MNRDMGERDKEEKYEIIPLRIAYMYNCIINFCKVREKAYICRYIYIQRQIYYIYKDRYIVR